MLVGRDRERLEIERVLGCARSGKSATLALVGEPGIGKTALLEHVAERAQEMQLLRARGVESEAQIPFGSLFELLRPALALLDRIPEPQAMALQSALALRPSRARDRFAVGAATLSLLATCSEAGPVAVLIDDAQWLDRPSAGALHFAFRRLLADPIAVVIAARAGVPSLLDDTDLPRWPLAGLSSDEAALLLTDLSPELAGQLHAATAGNPLALLELAPNAAEFAFAPQGAPILVSDQLARAFLRRAGQLGEAARRALVLAATCEGGDLLTLERAAARMDIDVSTLAEAEAAGLIRLRDGAVEFRHPLVRSSIYTDAPVALRRDAHRALAGVLADRDADRRAWHLAAAAAGLDESASAALAQAGARARARSAYSTAASAFGRAAHLTARQERRGRLLLQAAEASWHAGLADRAEALLGEARAAAGDPEVLLDIEELTGHIAARRGPVMRGHAILTAASERANPERAAAMLAEAAAACFYAGNPAELLSAADRARARLPPGSSPRSRLLASMAYGMAQTVGGDAAQGAAAIHAAVRLAEETPELHDDPQLLPWLAVAPVFLRESTTGRSLLGDALARARAQAAIGVLPFVLNLVALDHATTEDWQLAEVTYEEAIALARETDQQTDLAFGLSGLARLHARRGREQACRSCATEALDLCGRLGTRFHEIWAIEALGMLALGTGSATEAARHYERLEAVLGEVGITDPDLSPAPELVELYIRLDRGDAARAVAAAYTAAAEAKSQPWSLARALRCRAMLADDDALAPHFERALNEHQHTPDAFETARTRLIYGQQLRRARERTLAREQLRAALEIFERLGAHPWAERARAELNASGETLRRRDPATRDELTPQELQIALLLADGKTTRQAAAALFLSPKTIEYHLRHVYVKLGIHSREELKLALASQTSGEGMRASAVA